jgi:hypothetical protein
VKESGSHFRLFDFIEKRDMAEGRFQLSLRRLAPALQRRQVLTAGKLYLSVLPTSLNTVLTLPPTVWTAVIMNTAMSEAISAYSIAVTPASSAAKVFMDLNMSLLLLRNSVLGGKSVVRAANTARK